MKQLAVSPLQKEAFRVLFSAPDGAYASYRIPGIVCTADETLFISLEARSRPQSDWGAIDLMVLRSRDRGESWTQCLCVKPRADAPGAQTYSNPTLIADGALLHMLYHLNYERAYCVTSADAGETWGAPRDITPAYRAFPFDWNVCATGPGHGVALKNGRLAAPVWLAQGETLPDGTRRHWPSVAGYVISDDHGATWRAGALAPELYDGNETTLAQTADGALLFNFRTRDPRRKRFTGFVHAGSPEIVDIAPAEALDDPMCFGSMAALPDQSVALVHCDSARARENLSLHKTKDGLRWDTLGRVDVCGGYADIACGANALYAFYERHLPEENRVSELRFKRFSL